MYAPVISAVHLLLRESGYKMIAIDGRCGSGKTSLAQLLWERFECNVFHMDDFYLPFSQREEDWPEKVAGNMDLERFLREVLIPARSGRPVKYRRFDCWSGRLLEQRDIPLAPLTVIEGSYSHHPLLCEAYDLKVFLTCAPQEQRRRLREREGDNFESFEQLWIPMEERYYQAYDIEQGASLMVDTSALLAGSEPIDTF